MTSYIYNNEHAIMMGQSQSDTANYCLTHKNRNNRFTVIKNISLSKFQ